MGCQDGRRRDTSFSTCVRDFQASEQTVSLANLHTPATRARALGFWRFRHWGWHRRDWSSPDATEILKQRFARGDIDADEYKSRLSVIKGPQG